MFNLKDAISRHFFITILILVGMLGIIFQYFGVFTLKNAWQGIVSVATNKEKSCELAQACSTIPISEEDEIFFISCGGIY